MAKSSPERILQFWYAIEQLVPFDLTRAIKEGKHHAPIKIDDDNALPWIEPALLRSRFQLPAVKNGKVQEYTFQIYLGVFPIKSILDFIQSLPKPASSDFEDLVSTTKNLSCYASFALDRDGILVDQSLTCSTVPWALKRIGEILSAHRQLDLDKWTEDFQKHVDSVKQEFSSLAQANAEAHQKTTTFELRKLWNLVSQGLWQPEELTSVGYYVIKRASSQSDRHTNDILNSFYLSDLTSASTACATGKASKPLQQYLTATRPQPINVEDPTFLQHWLSPKYIPLGRWASDSAHNLSLMQQLAVNLGINRLKDSGGIFSVNGPPGTGKTTLLRDLIADLVVQRAEGLATYQQPSAAFSQTEGIYRPDASITGFEIVVASSNNAAVENVTRELPSLDALAPEYQTRATYLRSVSESVKAVAAKNSDLQENSPKTPTLWNEAEESPPDSTWGLIAAVLGNKQNCNSFSTGFWFNKVNSIRVLLKQEPDRGKWNAARQKFHQQKQLVNQLISERQRYWEQVKAQASLSLKYRQAKAKFLSSQIDLEKKQQLDLDSVEIQQQTQSQWQIYQSQLQQLLEHQPSWCAKLFKRKTYHRYQLKIDAARQNFQESQTELTLARIALEKARKDVDRAERDCQLAQEQVQRLEKAMLEFRHLDLVKAQLGKAFGDAQWWNQDQESLQFSAPWIEPELNSARTELFMAALEVHEQFMHQAAARISKNLSKWVDLVNGKSGDLKEDSILYLWQTLFLVVPVISTTLASMGRLFSRLPSESLGWLLIDEAGQGIPQAAVGALQRVQRAVVVGDPLQIEPVFTLDPALTKGLRDYFQIDACWSPAEASIQTLSDRANPLGTKIDLENEPMWIGCPLWVHRRCISPMFEIANEIAYNNRMVKATRLPNEEEFPLGDSRWIDIYGTCQGQHWVPQQGDEVVKLLTQVVEAQKALPNLYIISPFKSVSFKLQDLLKRTKGLWAKETDGVEEWIRRSVGTVHTFQGKEADAVILVLGADEGSSGAAMWASSRPNILNVAATRAKYRFYLVGSKKLWSRLRYFDEASRWLLLETKPPHTYSRVTAQGRDFRKPTGLGI